MSCIDGICFARVCRKSILFLTIYTWDLHLKLGTAFDWWTFGRLFPLFEIILAEFRGGVGGGRAFVEGRRRQETRWKGKSCVYSCTDFLTPFSNWKKTKANEKTWASFDYTKLNLSQWPNSEKHKSKFLLYWSQLCNQHKHQHFARTTNGQMWHFYKYIKWIKTKAKTNRGPKCISTKYYDFLARQILHQRFTSLSVAVIHAALIIQVEPQIDDVRCQSLMNQLNLFPSVLFLFANEPT